MILNLFRYHSAKDYTDGILMIDGEFECYTIEDEGRTQKVYGETRIPDGTYHIGLREEGSFHNRYKKFGFHKGMLCLYNKPDWKVVNEGMEFQYILIHIGNTDDDTAGCILVGTTADKNKGFIGASTGAYKSMYPKIAKAIMNKEPVTIKIQTVS